MNPIKMLTCSCCSQYTEGRQWWNRDKGYGLCDKCANIIIKKYDKEEMKSCYGEKGFHYLLEKK
jgi:hypothetical protein